MNINRNMKEIASSTVSGNPPDTGAYLLFATGEDVNWDLLYRELKAVPYFELGPYCWLVIPPPQEIRRFSEALSMALPLDDGKAELLLYHLSTFSILHGNAGGLGLADWLKKHGYNAGA